jgi:mono/diheme cytochrome c family protein
MRRRNTWLARRLALTVSVTIVVGCGSWTLRGPTDPSTTTAALPALDPSQVARGRQIYIQRCASCHGQQAEGAPNWQQPDARGDLPPPPHDDSGHTWRHSDAQLTEIIRQGLRDRFNKTPALTMPSFKDRLSDAEITAVITYFKSLWSSEHRAFQGEENRRPPMPTQRSGP